MDIQLNVDIPMETSFQKSAEGGWWLGWSGWNARGPEKSHIFLDALNYGITWGPKLPEILYTHKKNKHDNTRKFVV